MVLTALIIRLFQWQYIYERLVAYDHWRIVVRDALELEIIAELAVWKVVDNTC